mmetsp:Transcript_33047/g.93534  ORF Transcript_33047/g.93534 Transcript_33047/m.93534 type:complete len:206 (-) Transcript_33047:3-620(-)
MVGLAWLRVCKQCIWDSEHVLPSASPRGHSCCPVELGPVCAGPRGSPAAVRPGYLHRLSHMYRGAGAHPQVPRRGGDHLATEGASTGHGMDGQTRHILLYCHLCYWVSIGANCNPLPHTPCRSFALPWYPYSDLQRFVCSLFHSGPSSSSVPRPLYPPFLHFPHCNHVFLSLLPSDSCCFNSLILPDRFAVFQRGSPCHIHSQLR